MNEKMWDIFEKTGSIEAFLYIEESKKMRESKNYQTESSDELMPQEDGKEKDNEC